MSPDGDFYAYGGEGISDDRMAAQEESAPPAPAIGGMGGGPADTGYAANVAGLPSTTTDILTVDKQNQQGQDDRLIIRNGTVNVAVEDTYAAEKNIEAVVAQYAADGAFVVSTNESPTGYGESPYINMVIRVPATHFEEVMNTIAGLAAKGTTPTLTQNADDVTNQYVDVTARLAALELARDRLKEIMSEAQNTNDLLLAEQQLTQREAEIEALQGQKQYLEQSAALSSITVTLTPYVLSQPVDTSWRPLETVREAFDRLVESLRDFGDFVIIFVISVLPWLLIAALVVYGIFRFVRSRVARARNAGTGEE
jgi:hypothetical protein